MPISRFLADLMESGRYDAYMRKLVDSFNPATIDGLMCRSMLSVDWQGNLFDCDFNQMLNLPLAGCRITNLVGIDDQSLDALNQRAIVTGRHCFGCTAGAGSSCSGSLQ